MPHRFEQQLTAGLNERWSAAAVRRRAPCREGRLAVGRRQELLPTGLGNKDRQRGRCAGARHKHTEGAQLRRVVMGRGFEIPRMKVRRRGQHPQAQRRRQQNAEASLQAARQDGQGGWFHDGSQCSSAARTKHYERQRRSHAGRAHRMESHAVLPNQVMKRAQVRAGADRCSVRARQVSAVIRRAVGRAVAQRVERSTAERKG
jgi:hypothetical protein